MVKDATHFQLVYWEDVRNEVKVVNPDLSNIIDTISPDRRYPLVKACYQFGDIIVNKGSTFLPSAEGLLPLEDPGMQKVLGDKLSYSVIPLFLILKNANEVFIDLSSRTVPLNLFYPGSLLGLFESIDAIFNRVSYLSWSVSAGARNIFTLPKINEVNGFKKFKMAYGLSDELRSKNLTDHWRIFNAIARHPHFEQPWHNTVLFFTKPWILNSHKDEKWIDFRNYLFSNAWQQAQFAINKINLGVALEHVYNVIASPRIKPTVYLADQIKHITLIASGRWPGFKAADTLDEVGPIRGLQKALLNVYSLKRYYPTMMHISRLERSDSLHYYSLSYPTLFEGSPDNNSMSTLLSDLRDIKYLMDMIKSTSNNVKKINNFILSQTELDYFHVEADKYGEIKQSTGLLNLDPSLLNNQDEFPGREFCATSQFWRGAISIRKKLV